MKLKWDIHELINFGDRVSNSEHFGEYLGKATQEIAKKLHKMLISETPVDFGNLQAFWQTEENYSYLIIRKADGFEVTLINRALYATWVNDGHKQRPGRFIPGYWIGNHFRYDPTANEGMVLRKPWVQGKFFVENSILKVENSRAIERIIQKELQKWFRWCING
jgi:hypothetical protein